MGALANYGFRIIAFATLTLGAAGCGTYGVDPASPGYKALNAGDYAKAERRAGELKTLGVTHATIFPSFPDVGRLHSELRDFAERFIG